MRKLLLASAALLGGSLGAANAQVAPAPVIVPTPVPFTLTPSPTAGPGTISVRINARMNFYMQAGSDSGRNTSVVTTAPGVTTPTNTKLADYSFQEYARLFFNLDGIAGNGLKYGAFIEVRQDNGDAPGGGIAGSISSQSRTRGAMYFRNEGAYLGTDQLGFVRFGSTYMPSVLFATGTMENFNDGGWDGDLPSLFSGNTTPTWPFPDIGVFYVPSNVTYLSPQFYGVDFAASFAPNSGGLTNASGNCPYGNTAVGTVSANTVSGGYVGCDAASSTSVLGETTRPRNEAQIYARYRGAFGPVGIAAEVGGIFSGHVQNNNAPAVKASQLQYEGYRLFDAGLLGTFGGLAVGAHVTGGRQNGQFSLAPVGTKDSFAWVAGASYAMGPVIVGASYFDYMSTGANNRLASPFVGNRNEWGIAAGGTYNFAPGMNMYLSYLYGHRKELGVDLLSGVASSATTNVSTHNNVQSQGVQIGTQFRW